MILAIRIILAVCINNPGGTYDPGSAYNPGSTFNL